MSLTLALLIDITAMLSLNPFVSAQSRRRRTSHASEAGASIHHRDVPGTRWPA
jgi:hypothetical protein